MKQIIIALFLTLFYLSSEAQDYSLLYQLTVEAPPLPNGSAPVSAKGVSYSRLLIKDKHSIYYNTNFDTLFNENYQNNLKGVVFYGDISKKEILLLDKTNLPGFATKYPFSAQTDWKIHKEFIPFQQFKAYLATKKTAKGETIKAYFVPQIQITVGPREYAGLPGLIISMETAAGVLKLKKIERPKLAAIDRSGLDALTILPNETYLKKRTDAVIKNLMNKTKPASNNTSKQCTAPKEDK